MIPACRLVDLPRGEAYRLDIDPPVSVFHTDDGEVFAIDDTCTHQDASLADGWLEGCEVECPLHASKFDLRTGAVDAPLGQAPGPHSRGPRRGRHDLRPAVPGRAQPAALRRGPARRLTRVRTVAVVGASLAGLSAARSLRKQGYDGRLVVIGDELHRPYDRPPLSKEFLVAPWPRPIWRWSRTPRTCGHSGCSASAPSVSTARSAPYGSPTAARYGRTASS